MGWSTVLLVSFLVASGMTAVACNEQRGDSDGSSEIEVGTGQDAGRIVAAQSGCLACHRIEEAGNEVPGGDLTTVGDDLSPDQIRRSILEGPGIMPSYRALKPRQLDDLVAFLATLK